MTLSRRLSLTAGLVALAATAPAPAQAAFPANNGRIVFTRTVAAGNTDIFTAARDGSGAGVVASSPAADEDAAWSPDGQRIAFASARNGNLDIYVMNADGSGLTQLTGDPGADTDPAWSPDGTQLAFVSDRANGGRDVWAMSADGSLQRDLTNTPIQTTPPVTRTNPDGTVDLLYPPVRYGTENNPAWSPNGTRIAFSSDRSRRLDIYTMAADGTGQVAITAGGGADDNPAWSPDGTRIAYATSGFAGMGVEIASSSGALIKSLVDPFASDRQPAFSPDGRSVVFSGRIRPGGDGLYRMPADGSGLLKVTSGADNDPDWQPCATCPADATFVPPPPPPVDVGSKPTLVSAGKPAGGGTAALAQLLGGEAGAALAAKAAKTSVTLTGRVISVRSANLVRVRLTKPRKVFDVHIIGIDVPKAGECGGTQSRVALRKLLVSRSGLGRVVRVATDPKVDATDSRGRVNGYLTVAGTRVELAQIAAGWAKAKGGSYAMARRFRAAQSIAKKRKRGVWKSCSGSFHAPRR